MPVTDLTGTTWVLDDAPDISTTFSYSLDFSSNGISYVSIFVSNSGFIHGLGFGQKNGATYQVYGSDIGWDLGPTDKIITITGGTDATNASAIAWFEANGTLQTPTTPRKSVDLTTLPGWSSLSSGSHSITIVAKADGYRDSEPSVAVSVTKASANLLTDSSGNILQDSNGNNLEFTEA